MNRVCQKVKIQRFIVISKQNWKQLHVNSIANAYCRNVRKERLVGLYVILKKNIT